MARQVSAASAIGALIALSFGSSAVAQDNEQAFAALAAESSSPAAAIAAARTQTDQGDLTGAAATLERALLTDPNAHDARLLYAATLCRLGDSQAARIEIAKLDRQDVDSSAWAEADTACGGALRRPLPPGSDSDGLAGEAYVGLAYDGDASGATQLQSDFGFGGSDREDGIAAIAGARLLWRGRGYASGGAPYVGAGLTSKHDLFGPAQDYDVGHLRAGWGRTGNRSSFSLGALLGHTRLSGDPYVTEYGGQAELLLGNAETRRFRFRAEAVAQNYKDGFPGDAADGGRFDLSAAFESRLGGKRQFALGLAGELKTADVKTFGYRGARLFGALHLPTTNDQYFGLSGTLRYIDFRDDPPFADRKDLRGFARAAYGIPLNSSGLFVEGAASYTFRQVSLSSTTGGSIPDLKIYHSPGADLRLIWRF